MLYNLLKSSRLAPAEITAVRPTSGVTSKPTIEGHFKTDQW
jgi:hypothetical protein